MAKQSVIAFDLVGTLLDLSVLDAAFGEEFGNGRIRREWFSEVQQLMFSITALGGYESFANITESALKIIEERHQKELSLAKKKHILEGLRELPAFPDVSAALERLQRDGHRLIVLTNSGSSNAKQLIDSADLATFFAEVLSSESVKRLKPAPDAYQMAAKKSGVKAKDLLLVAAHSWDVAGAKEAACRTCFVQRPEQILNDLTPKPDFVVADIGELADRLEKEKRAA